MNDSKNKLSLASYTILLFSFAISGFNIDIFQPALPHLTKVFHVTAQTMQKSISYYLLGFSILQIIVGPLSDKYGRKRIVVYGMAFYSLSCFTVFFIKDIHQFFLVRFLQGMFTTAPVVLSKAVVADSYKDIQLKKSINHFVVAWAIGPICAPLIGAVFLTYFSWQIIFFFLGIYSFILFILLCFFLQETGEKNLNTKIISNFILLPKLMIHPIFLSYIGLMSFGYAFILVFYLYGPYILINKLHFSALFYGKVSIITGFGCFCGAVLNLILLSKFSTRQIIGIGIKLLFVLVIIMLGSILIYGYQAYSLIFFITLISIIVCMYYSSCSADCFTLFDKKYAGSISSILGTFSILGSFLITLVASYFNPINFLSLPLCYLALLGLSLFLNWYIKENVNVM